jgi:hypothetical protein
MGIVLVTVAGPQRRADLALPAEAAVGELIADLVALCVDPAQQRPPARWALAPIGGAPFPPGQPLEALGILDGSVLELRDMTSAQPPATPPRMTVVPGQAEAGDPERHQRLQRITGLVEDLLHDAARRLTGEPAGGSGAGTRAVEDLRAVLSPSLQAGARLVPSFGDVELVVHWTGDRQAAIDVTAEFVDRSFQVTETGEMLQFRPASTRISLRIDAEATRVLKATAQRDDGARG